PNPTVFVLIPFSLALDSTALGDDELEAIGGLAGLTTLDLDQTGVTDANFTQLARLPRLQRLSLDLSPQITDASVPTLGRMQSLRSLSLGNTSIRSAAAAHLGPMLPTTAIQHYADR